ncbi:hypothetical protein [Desulfurivibrio sp. C05AmB]|uniref:hypothetical protein n=1 Tax=Desulfurivibrio sp. C05AmB TaxID=3374371 RepID=UPI00376EA439
MATTGKHIDRLVRNGRIRITFPQRKPDDAGWRCILQGTLAKVAGMAGNTEEYLLVNFDGHDGTLYADAIDDFLCSLNKEQYEEYWYPRVTISEVDRPLEFIDLSLVITSRNPAFALHPKGATGIGSSATLDAVDALLRFGCSKDLELNIFGDLELIVIEN